MRSDSLKFSAFMEATTVLPILNSQNRLKDAGHAVKATVIPPISASSISFQDPARVLRSS